MTAPDRAGPDRTGTLYFEDFTPGRVFEWGEMSLSAEDIVAFGRQFDPVPLHTDAAAAAQSQFGGLIASGWQVAALMQRMQYECYLKRAAVIASPGVDGLEFRRPVRPGEPLSLRVEVIDSRRSRSRPDRGLVRVLATLIDRDGETVLEKRGKSFFRTRPAEAGAR
ncbi:MAG: acyl dehydratase [Rhodospirillaceae bacterium]|nr:MaoC/PaaZ C-terminal domain-containing protein [Rhodospirillaceae bacterium]MCY4066609.1 MaoC/PaaZ C-terminal domain-containing protein [Rhodospirillaceae bacterium]MXW93838.1 acyl dehydratase [Rhodospirillaceae bacterium]MYB14171.1 acyl dehydratase [Rhodospirillaceae bacterium]MYG50770.1 acyl dehydratase [Rhodospirillaceae bacterium]